MLRGGHFTSSSSFFSRWNTHETKIVKKSVPKRELEGSQFIRREIIEKNKNKEVIYRQCEHICISGPRVFPIDFLMQKRPT